MKNSKCFDALLIGNGSTINLLNQLSLELDVEKSYLLKFDDFCKALSNDEISYREKRIICSVLYRKDVKDSSHYIKMLQQYLIQFYQMHDGNIEYHLGVWLFDKKNCPFDYDLTTGIFPVLYNLWHQLLVDYVNYSNKFDFVYRYCDSILTYLCKAAKVYTINFDCFLDTIPAEHLHGKFVERLKCYDDAIYYKENDGGFKFKNVWGWNGIGKFDFISTFNKRGDCKKYFDFSFFFDNDLFIENLLVYGVGFQVSGYVDNLKLIRQGESLYVGGIVDEHLLIRFKELQNKSKLKNITFAFYNEDDKERYRKLVDFYGLINVMWIQSNELKFSI